MKLITNDSLSTNNMINNNSLQVNFVSEKKTDEILNLDDNEIINELLLYENFIRRGIYEDYIQLIKRHVKFKNKNETKIFNYLLDHKEDI
jgi:hypothetical protein